MSPRKKPAPRAVVDDAAAEQTAGEDAAAGAVLEAIRQAQRDAVLGPARSAPLMRDDTLPAPMVADVLARFREAGHAWALTGRIEFGDLAPTFVEVEPHEEGPPMFRVSLFGMGAVNGGYSRGLAERYLAECALVGDETRTASERLNSRALWRSQVHALRVMREDAPPDMAERFTRTSGNVRDISDYLTRFDAWRFDVAFAEKSGTTVPPEPEPPAWLSPPKAQALASVARELTKPQADGSVLLVANRRNLETRLREEVPFVRAMLDELAALTETCERPATLEDVDAWTLGREDGTLAPTPEAWLESLAARGEQHRADASAWLYMGMEALATDARKAREADLKARTAELERQLDEERARVEEQRARAEKAEREAAREKRQRLTGLSDRIVLPGQLVRSGYSPEMFTKLAERLTEGQTELFALDNAREVIRAHASVQCDTSQLGNLSTAEVRGMLGVYRLFSAKGDDRETFVTHTVSVPAATLYLAAEINPRKTKEQAALFNGLRGVTQRELTVALTMQSAKGEWCVIGDQTRMFEMQPVWTATDDKRRPLTEEDARALADHYVQHMRDGKPWGGRLPDHYVFTLSKLMQRIAGRLVFRGDLLARLQEGSRAVRGPQAGLSNLDYRLLVEITQRQQANQKSEDGLRYRSYVDRERVLRDHYPEFPKWKRAGKLREKAHPPYENSARALIAAGLVARWEPGYRTSAGELRDVFELAPDVVLGNERRLTDPTQGQLFGAKKGRRPRAKKGTV